MGADIAIGYQPFTWQVDQDTLLILVREIENLPLMLSQLTDLRDCYMLNART